VGSVSAGIQFQFDYRYDTAGFFNDTARRSTLETAAAAYSNIADDLAELAPQGVNRWTARLIDPSTGSLTEINNLHVPADTVMVFVGARDLPESTLASAGPGGYSVRGTNNWIDTVAARGETGALLADPTDFGPWGGSLSFDTQDSAGNPRNWHYDIETLPSTGQTDFYSVVMHELAHILGFGTSNAWDQLVVDGEFFGTQSTFFNDGPISLDPLDSHWVEGTDSFIDGDPQEALMDPTLVTGRRKLVTALDYAGLQDFGWEPMIPTIFGDIDGNRRVDARDIDLLYDRFGPAGAPEDDLNGDGQIDQDDVTILVEQILDTVYGDVTLDRRVNETDLAYLADNWRQDVTGWASGDFSGDGFVSEADLAYLADTWKIALPTAVAVPEPGSLGGAVVMGWLMSLRRRANH
jgi:hypothetical protein